MIKSLLKFLFDEGLRVSDDGILRSGRDNRPIKLKSVMPLERQDYWQQRIAEVRAKGRGQ